MLQHYSYRLVLFLLCLAISNVSKADKGLDNRFNRLKNKIQTDFDALEGMVGVLGYEQCKELIESVGSCLGVNPAAPYFILMHPAREGQYQDPYYGDNLNYEQEGQAFEFQQRLAEQEAFLSVIKVPPKAAYFSYVTYVSSIQKINDNPWYDFLDQYLPSAKTKNPNRAGIFNTFGDPLNNQAIANHIGVKSPWNRYIYVITTADNKTDRKIRNVLKQMNVNERFIFTEKIGKSVKDVGLAGKDSEFFVLLRYVFPNDETGLAYQSNPLIKTMRVLPKQMEVADRFPDTPLRVQQSNDESGLSSQLKKVQVRLRNKIFGWKLLNGFSSFYPSQLVGVDSRSCLVSEMNCLGENRDTDSYRFTGSLKLGSNEAILFVGVNHTETENASYVSLSPVDGSEFRPSEIIKGNQIMGGISEVADLANLDNPAKHLQGTATDLMKSLRLRISDLPDLDKFYAILLARNCSGLPNCFELPTSSINGIPVDREFRVLQRAYLKPGTASGAKNEDLLSPTYYIGNPK